MKNEEELIFKKGSKTFFGSSLFFPKPVRDKITTFYAFVRQADDLVDSIPQNSPQFYNFLDNFMKARKGKVTTNPIINSFAELEKQNHFPHQWIDAFLSSMKQDLTKHEYETIEETEHYMYGSANVIGLCLAAILNLPKTSYPYAQMLGKSLQFLNFIRDIEEDQELKRTYFPRQDLKQFGIASLSRQYSLHHRQNFSWFIRFQITRYRSWQKEAEKGFKYIPKQYLIPIKTASDLYAWTADVIEQNPFIVYEKKVKPEKVRIYTTGIRNYVFLGIF